MACLAPPLCKDGGSDPALAPFAFLFDPSGCLLLNTNTIDCAMADSVAVVISRVFLGAPYTWRILERAGVPYYVVVFGR